MFPLAVCEETSPPLLLAGGVCTPVYITKEVLFSSLLLLSVSVCPGKGMTTRVDERERETLSSAWVVPFMKWRKLQEREKERERWWWIWTAALTWYPVWPRQRFEARRRRRREFASSSPPSPLPWKEKKKRLIQKEGKKKVERIESALCAPIWCTLETSRGDDLFFFLTRHDERRFQVACVVVNTTYLFLFFFFLRRVFHLTANCDRFFHTSLPPNHKHFRRLLATTPPVFSSAYSFFLFLFPWKKKSRRRVSLCVIEKAHKSWAP